MWDDIPGHDGPIAVDEGRLARFQGCLAAGAVGDALGAPIEFLSLGEIRSRFGSEGLQDYHPAYGRLGAITDDTQMTLFTAEGLLRADIRSRFKGICNSAAVVRLAYLRWLRTQGFRSEAEAKLTGDYYSSSWLMKVPELFHQRVPGNSCISALMQDEFGTVDEPINDSKGCGGVMRVGPLGLIAVDPMELGIEVAAITHGHPSGCLAAGAFAYLVQGAVMGTDLLTSVSDLLDNLLPNYRGYEETFDALKSAVELYKREPSGNAEAVETLGGGWVAEEALAIAVYCALCAGDDLEKGVLLAVNHSGDADSTVSVTGNLMGARLGVGSIPQRWLTVLELRETIEQLAYDLTQAGRADDDWWNRYPGF
jgi:ADP-ribosylglycohydrolase